MSYRKHTCDFYCENLHRYMAHVFERVRVDHQSRIKSKLRGRKPRLRSTLTKGKTR